MRRLVIAVIAVLGAAFLVSSSIAGSSNGVARPFFTNVALSAGGSGTEAYLATTGLDVPAVGYGTIAVRVASSSFADSVSADSIAMELFLLGDAQVDSSGFSPITTDDSREWASGWFLTTYDSTSAAGPGNITPITGATASVTNKFPYGVSSRVVTAELNAFAGTRIPGANLIRLAGGNYSQNRYARWFFLQLNDGFGGSLCRGFRKITVAALNRQPRLGYTVSAWLLPSAD